jgi:hypothetical protein
MSLKDAQIGLESINCCLKGKVLVDGILLRQRRDAFFALAAKQKFDSAS